jgi:hypothetical protein
LGRKELRELRAILHNAARHGLASQNRNGHPNFFAYLQGRVALASMVDPVCGTKLKRKLAEIREASGDGSA